MEIRTYVGTEFSISSVDENVQLPFYNGSSSDSYRGDLINPKDLRALASIIEWGEAQGVELDFSID